MENNFIKLNKVREFGDVFNDTFAFIGQEAKPLSRAILVFALPLLLISSLAMAYLQSQQLNNIYGTPNFDIWGYIGKVATIIVFVILAQNMLMVTVYSYVKLYHTKGPRKFDNNDIFSEIIRYFFPCLGTAVVLAIITGVGFVMCLIPGIYLGISLSFVIPIMILENPGFGTGFSRSFDLTHKQWWWTFLIIVVYIILAYVFMIILSLPAMIIGFTSILKTQDMLEGTYNYPFYLIIYNAFVSLISTLFYAVLHIAIIFQYFNIVEMYEGKSLSERIEKITDNDQV
jgi:hypothetical protein